MKDSYGFDNLSRDILVFAVLLGVIGFMFIKTVVGIVLCFFATLLTALVLYRTMSNKTYKRKNELNIYNGILFKIKNAFRRMGNSVNKGASDMKNFRRFRCPNCRQRLRVPRHKGKIRITCSKCGTKFERKT